MISSVSELQSLAQSAQPGVTESSNNACATNVSNLTTKPVKSKKATDAKAIDEQERVLGPYKLFRGFDMIFFIRFYYAALQKYWCGWNTFTSCYFYIPFFGLLILFACFGAIARKSASGADRKMFDNYFQVTCWILFVAYIAMIKSLDHA